MSRKHPPRFSLFAFQDIITSITGIMILVTLLLALDLVEEVKQTPAAQTAELIDDLKKKNAALQKEQRDLQARLAAAAEDPDALLDEKDIRRKIAEVEARIKLLGKQLGRDSTRAVQGQQSLDKDRKRLLPKIAELTERLKKRQQELAVLRAKLKSALSRTLYRFTELGEKEVWLVEIRKTELVVAPLGRQFKPLRFAGPKEFVTWAYRNCKPAAKYHFFLIVFPGGVERFEQVENRLRFRGYSLGKDLLPSDQRAIDPQLGAP